MDPSGLQDTVAAIATPPGRGAIALIRVSGPHAADILVRVCSELQGVPAARVQHLARVHHPETKELLETALVTFFPRPRSYTGEDVVELSTHGGDVAPQRVLDALLASGARQALPGEFTRRAVLNGKLDLLQAEAVGDLIDARSPAFHRAALHQMERGLSTKVEELRSHLLAVEAMVSYGIDFPDEDEPPVPLSSILEAAGSVHRRMEEILATAPEGELLRQGALVVLAGVPNSGKSSLFNALLGTERAIVTEIPGTTRDAVEADATILGYPFRFVDTAGLRETADRVEAMGIEVARRYLAAADLVVLCAEAGQPMTTSELGFLREVGGDRLVLVRTKIDLVSADRSREPSDGAQIGVSSRTREGLRSLMDELVRRAFGGTLRRSDTIPLVTSERQARALRRAAEEVESFITATKEELPAEFSATHLRTATELLEDLIGAVSTDDILDVLFSRFCVGK